MISLIICTHNPRADYFARCLAGLEAQTLPRDEWELLIIDNASAPDRAPTMAQIDWHPRARIVPETKLGLTPARLSGIREAKGDLLVLVDDDNVLDPDFLAVARDIAHTRPHLGSWSGQCRPGFEEPPPEWTRRYWGNLAIREFDKDIWSNMPRLPETMPCGAGLCIRREAALHYLHLNDTGQRSFQLDRTGNSLISGGDNDLAACACDVGLGVGLMKDLKLTHLIPPQRLTVDYLARLAEGIYRSAVVLAYLRGETAELAAYRVKLHHRIRASLTPQPHRNIAAAALRGRSGGLALVSRFGEISK